MYFKLLVSPISKPSSVFHHPSSVIRHLSSVICHLSSVICHHSSFIIPFTTFKLFSLLLIYFGICRTNNVTNLEEENIKLFIEKAKEFYNIDNIFKKHIHKVFKDFNNFYLVLNAIAQLSCKIKDSTPKLVR